jgi:flagellar motor switch protein FliN/FliY
LDGSQKYFSIWVTVRMTQEFAARVETENAIGAKLREVVPPMARRETVDQPGGSPVMDALMKIPVKVQVVLGTVKMPVAKVMELARGSVLPLGQKLGEPVSIVVNGREIARGEVVILDEETGELGISLTEVTGSPLSGKMPDEA